MTTERAYWLAWSRIKDVGPVTIKRLWEHFGALSVAWQASASELLAVDGIGLLSAEKITRQRPKLSPDRLLAQHEQENQSFWTPADPDYPKLLFTINDPPPLLYYRGDLRLNDPNVLTVGMVGTRRPSAYGKRWTQRLSRQLTQQGATIISGLAAGIDTDAHTSCLSQKGLTVAVMGTGADVVYPHFNSSLYEWVVKTGLVVSEYPDGTGPDRSHFPQRNRIIAGLSRALLVMEAPARSGALITARLANDYCREVYALPTSLDNDQGQGCLHLISQGAQMILDSQTLMAALEALPAVDAIATAATALPRETSPNLSSNQQLLDRPADRPADQLSDRSSDRQLLVAAQMSAKDLAQLESELAPLLRQVLAAVSVEPVVLDQIVQCAQIDTGAVLGALVQLEISGLVVQLPGMHYQRI
ncbi:MAG: DNA-processing protein DprA [Phormidesmis sp.]